MTNQEAIETIEANYPPENYSMLREALDMAIELLKEQETSNVYKCPNCGTWVSAENVVRGQDCKWYDSYGFLLKM